MREACSLIWSALVLLFRSRASFAAEILVLRHQINIRRRHSPKRQTFSAMDRLIFAGLYRLAPTVLNALAVLKPDTVIKWHRATGLGHLEGGRAAASGKAGSFLALDWCAGTPLDALARRNFALHAALLDRVAGNWGYRRMTASAASSFPRVTLVAMRRPISIGCPTASSSRPGSALRKRRRP
jgi:hypothetical protein